MKGLQEKKGITLIALIVSIIILLILAGMSVSMINGEGLFGKAKLAKQTYLNSQSEEEQDLEDMYSQLLVASDGTIQNLSMKQLDQYINEKIETAKNELRNELSAVGTTPIGTIVARMSNSIPSGYLKCDGSWYDINGTYSALAEFINTEFGSYDYFKLTGEESQANKFKVPDLRGEFLRGTGTNSHINQGSGANIGEHQDGTEIYGMVSQTACLDYNNYDSSYSANGNWKGTANASSGAGSFFMIRPTNTSVLYCIKY